MEVNTQLKKYILNFTPTGMIPTKTMTPHVPVEPAEIIEQVIQAVDLGVNMVHLHARDGDGVPTYSKEIYAELISGIRQRHPKLVICISTSGRNFPEFEKRSAALELTGDLKPDFGSLTLSSLNFIHQASVNSPEMIQRLAGLMLENGIRPELEAFDSGMVNFGKYLIKKGLAKPPFYFNLILGNIANAQASLSSVGLMISELPEGSIWSLGGIGDSQLVMNSTALAHGGGIRIGLEDNIYYDADRTKLASNLELIERIRRIGDALGREPYSLDESRDLLGCR